MGKAGGLTQKLQLLPEEEEPPLEPPLDEPPLLEPPPLLLPPLEELPPMSRPPEIGLPAVPEARASRHRAFRGGPRGSCSTAAGSFRSNNSVLELPNRDMVLCWEELAASIACVMHE